MCKHDESNVQESSTEMHNKTCIEPTSVDNLTNDFINMTFVNTGKLENKIYPATVSEITAEQLKDKP